MTENQEKKWPIITAVAIFVIYTIWWIFLQISHLQPNNLIFDYFAASYCLMALFGGIGGLRVMKKWGGLKSLMGRIIFMFSLGLLAQAFGQLVYTYYVMVLKIEIPYPSIGDIGYFGSIIFYVLGVLNMAKISGVNFSLKTVSHKIQAVIIPLLILGYSYFLFLTGYEFDWSQPLKIILDFGYPLGQALYISLALFTLWVTKNILGGIMKPKLVLIFFALLTQYLADFNFLFQESKGTWTYGGYGDYLYFLAYFIMVIALLQLRSVYYQIKNL